MNFSEKPKATPPNWSHHIEQAKKYNGSYASYCREHNLDYDQFIYYRDKFKNKARRQVAKELQSGHCPMQSGYQNLSTI